MARQKTYSLDPNIQGADRLTGVRSENSNTANYSIDDIADFLSNTGNADGSRLGWRYDYGGEYDSSVALQPGKMYIQFLDDSQTKDFSNIRTIYFKNESKDNHSIVPMRQHLAGGILKLANTSTPEQRDYAVYRVTTAAAVSGKTDETFMTLIHIDSDGTFGADELVISVFQSGIGVESEGVVLRSGTELPEGNEVGLQGDFYIQYEVINELDDVPLRLFGPKASSNGAADWGDGVSMRGLAATLNVGTTETLDPGEDAVVSQRGTNTDRIFDFEIPRGEAGIDGVTLTRVELDSDSLLNIETSRPEDFPNISQNIRGLQGLQGIQGLQGNQGIQGLTGPAGVGTPGIDGTDMLSGLINPVSGVGKEGDFYLNTITYELFGPKGASDWPADGEFLRGTDGVDGVTLDRVEIVDDVLHLETNKPDEFPDIAVNVKGDDGTPGVDGRTILNGIIPPVDTQGAPGDFFFDTVSDRFYGPKGSDDTWDLTLFIDLSPPTASISVEEVGVTPDAALATLDCIKFTGSGVVSVLPDPDNIDCVIVTIAGGGGGVTEQIEDFAFIESGFVTDTFNATPQIATTFQGTWTAPDGVTLVSFTINEENDDFASQTETTVANLDGDVTFTIPSFTTGTDNRIVTTGTLVYTDADSVTQTLVMSVTNMLNKIDPVIPLARVFSVSPTFAIAPSNNMIEQYDSGTITYSTTAGRSLNDWTVGTETVYSETGDGDFVDNVYTVSPGDTILQTTAVTELENDEDDTQTFTTTSNENYTRVTSFRYGTVPPVTEGVVPSFSDDNADTYGIRNLTDFMDGINTIDFGNEKPAAQINFVPPLDEYIYFMVPDTNRITSILQAPSFELFDVEGLIVEETVGAFRVYTISNPTVSALTNRFTIT